jgi:multidrug efflux pump subunit AcrA (membrane-fusion protein)
VIQVSLSRRCRLRSRARLLAVVLATVVAGLSLSACKEIETESATGYEPAKLEPIKGKSEDFQRVTFTKEGAGRVDLETATVKRIGGEKVVPYAALIYNDEVKTFVYTNPKPLTFERVEVAVDRIEGNRVLLSEGPPVGAKVVTQGATQVYGTELDIAGSH